MITAYIVASIISFLLCWSAMPRAQFHRLLLDQRGGEGDGKIDFNSKEFQDSVATVASQMLSARTKSLKKEILDETKANFEGFAKALAPKFDALEQMLQSKKDRKNKQGNVGDGGGDDDPPNPVDNSPMLRTLQKQVEELTISNKKLAEAREQEALRNRNMIVRTKLREALEANGVTDPFKVKAATAILIDSERKVQYSESFEDAAFIDTDGEPIVLDQAIRSWLQTEEGEHYASPAGVNGAGSRPRGGRGKPPPGPEKITETDIGGALLKVLRNTDPNGQ